MKKLKTLQELTETIPGHDRVFVPRSTVSRRWGVSLDSIRRKERSGELTPIRLGPNTVRYDLKEIEEIERHATA